MAKGSKYNKFLKSAILKNRKSEANRKYLRGVSREKAEELYIKYVGPDPKADYQTRTQNYVANWKLKKQKAYKKKPTKDDQFYAVRKGTIYLVRIYNDKEDFIKLGYTSKAISLRFKQLYKYGYKYTVLRAKASNKAEAVELYIHDKINKDFRHWPERRFGGYTECYKRHAERRIVKWMDTLIP